MAGYLARRAVWTVFVLAAISLITFSVIQILPGDVALLIVGADTGAADPQALARMRQLLGTDQPILVQYGRWVGRALTGDLGTSLVHKRSIAQEVKNRLPVTLELAVLSLLLAGAAGIPLGVVAAVRRGAVDATVQAFLILKIAAPSFFVALGLLYLGARYMPFIPILDYVPFWEQPGRNLALMTFPVLSVSLGIIATVAQHTRAAVLDVMRQQYVATARAKGLAERTVVYRHVLKNALIPVLTIMGLITTNLVGGTVVIETIFALPGLGRMTMNAIDLRDFPVVQGAVLVITTLVVVVNLATDVLYGIIDPRIRYS